MRLGADFPRFVDLFILFCSFFLFDLFVWSSALFRSWLLSKADVRALQA